MLDFSGEHNIITDEVIPIRRVNEAYERLVKADVKYRFSSIWLLSNLSERTAREKHMSGRCLRYKVDSPSSAQR